MPESINQSDENIVTLDQVWLDSLLSGCKEELGTSKLQIIALRADIANETSKNKSKDEVIRRLTARVQELENADNHQYDGVE